MLQLIFRLFSRQLAIRDRISINPATIRVIDGDTIEVEQIRYRQIGFDAPETYQARCAHELAFGIKATNKLRRLINEARSHALATTKTFDKYKRPLATLYLDAIDVAQLMTRPDYAAAYDASSLRRTWCGCSALPSAANDGPQ